MNLKCKPTEYGFSYKIMISVQIKKKILVLHRNIIVQGNLIFHAMDFFHKRCNFYIDDVSSSAFKMTVLN